jgi:phage/plasmid-associated DNA primase
MEEMEKIMSADAKMRAHGVAPSLYGATTAAGAAHAGPRSAGKPPPNPTDSTSTGADQRIPAAQKVFNKPAEAHGAARKKKAHKSVRSSNNLQQTQTAMAAAAASEDAARQSKQQRVAASHKSASRDHQPKQHNGAADVDAGKATSDDSDDSGGAEDRDEHPPADIDSEAEPAEEEPPQGAWELTFHEAEAHDELDFATIEAAVQHWNADTVMREWLDVAAVEAICSPELEKLNQKLMQRFDAFVQSLVAYLNKFWTFIKDLAVPMVIQRVMIDDKDHPGRKVADVVKQGERGFASSMQNRFAIINWLANQSGVVRCDPRKCNLVSLWLKSPHRNDKRKITFVPKDSNTSDFNMWSGFSCTSDMAARHAAAVSDWHRDAKMFTDHIAQIWCQGDPTLAEYVLSWLAHLLQFPEIKLGTALLVRGEHGAGKGVVTMLMRAIIGRVHFSHFVNLAQMTGQYNGEFLEKCILGVVDEVLTNKEVDMSKVKALITEDSHTVEQKYIAPYKIDSFANFIFLSNNDHMMRIEGGERRFLVLEASGRYAGAETPETMAYFARLAQPDGPLINAVAHFLYTRNVGQFRPRAIPENSATMQQKLLSLNCVQRWWVRCLREGAAALILQEKAIDATPFPGGVAFSAAAAAGCEWQSWRPKSTVFKLYQEWCVSEGDRPEKDNMFWLKLGRCAEFETSKRMNTTGAVKKREPSVRFACQSACVTHFASKVLRVGSNNASLFRAWLTDEPSHAESAADASASI